MIHVAQLTKTYEDPDGGEVRAVSDATLTCNAGEIYGLLGPNGAGKTTTLRCLATILTPTSGTASIAGHDLLANPEGVRRSIGFLSANTGLYARLTPRETLRFFGALHGMSGEQLEARVEALLATFDVTSYADRPNDRLSTGMKQRVGLARAAVHDPPVLILDEPTTGLDPIVSRTVEEAVVGLARQGKCVLFSTHLLHQAEDICTRIGVIGDGRVLAEGTIPELCERTGTRNLREAFFALVGTGGVTLVPERVRPPGFEVLVPGATTATSVLPLPPGEGRGEGGVGLAGAPIVDAGSPHPSPAPLSLRDNPEGEGISGRANQSGGPA